MQGVVIDINKLVFHRIMASEITQYMQIGGGRLDVIGYIGGRVIQSILVWQSP